jgi:4-aminobutyrate aminotransferase-like enzyme
MHMASRSAAAVEPSTRTSSYGEYVNPLWVNLLNILDMNVEYERCIGAELFTRDGRRVLDFLFGYCVHNTGHNHPAIVKALKDELDKSGPAMLQSHIPELAEKNFRTQICGNNFMVLKAAPPLVISEAHSSRRFATLSRLPIHLPRFGQRLWRWLGAQPKSKQHCVRICFGIGVGVPGRRQEWRQRLMLPMYS